MSVNSTLAILRGLPDVLLDDRKLKHPEELKALDLIRLERDKSKMQAFARLNIKELESV